MWVLDRTGNRIRVLSADGLAPVGTIAPRVPPRAFGVAILGNRGRIWAAYADPGDQRGWLVRVDPGTGRQRVLATRAGEVS
ncbi:MAG: hypothetical protein LCI03_05590, partial [Actinobacteria bacterium]|nr:hypothetical protein [Actinomycetota bacterium]